MTGAATTGAAAGVTAADIGAGAERHDVIPAMKTMASAPCAVRWLETLMVVATGSGADWLGEKIAPMRAMLRALVLWVSRADLWLHTPDL